MDETADERVHELYSRNGKRRIAILRRRNGTYYYQREDLCEIEHEMCWMPGNQSYFGIYDSRETAMTDAATRVRWLRDARRQGRP